MIPPATLFYCHVQRDLARALDMSHQNYDWELVLSQDSREELEWWDSKLLDREFDLTIDSNALLSGWGTACQDRGSLVRMEKSHT